MTNPKKDGFKNVWNKETDWRKMHIFRLRAAVGKGLASQALRKGQKGHGMEPTELNSRVHRTFVLVDGTSWKPGFFGIFLFTHPDNDIGNES